MYNAHTRRARVTSRLVIECVCTCVCLYIYIPVGRSSLSLSLVLTLSANELAGYFLYDYDRPVRLPTVYIQPLRYLQVNCRLVFFTRPLCASYLSLSLLFYSGSLSYGRFQKLHSPHPRICSRARRRIADGGNPGSARGGRF